MESKSDPQRDHVLVTGVCGDIGSHLAKYFLGKGFRVLGLDIASEPPRNCYGQERLKFASCDLIDPEATSAAIDEFVGEYGPIRIVINNVGIIFNCPVVQFV